MVSGRILQGNLDPFLITLGWVVGYTLDEDDWERVTTDLLDGSGVTLEFDGNQKMTVNVAVDGGAASYLKATVDVAADLDAQVELAFAVFQTFALRKSRA